VRQVVVTGVGLVSPIGADVETFWQSVIEGRHGIRRVTRFDVDSFACQLGGEVTDCTYEERIDPRKLRGSTHATQLALAAAELALDDARLQPTAAYEPDRTAVTLGTALGGFRDGEKQFAILLERGARRVNPFMVNGSPYHASGGEIAAAVGAQGPQTTFSSGCPSALQAISYGASLVATDETDLCLAGGTESPLSPLVFTGMGRTMQLATLNDEPERASRPFDREHCGMVLSEGACFLVLEPLDRALARGARPYAEVLGGASSCDASGLYGFDESGGNGARTIQRLLKRHELAPEDVDYVCSHANSAVAFDRKETFVLHKAFGECAADLPVSSIKGVLGHPFGAAGAFQAATSALTLQRQLIPATHNLEDPDPECRLNHVQGEARAAHVRTALITSYGYGGANSYLLLAAARS
jgi:3-oxoacyl-[acyl-carrier-protein] synthase II